jgi:hypothetical protein
MSSRCKWPPESSILASGSLARGFVVAARSSAQYRIRAPLRSDATLWQEGRPMIEIHASEHRLHPLGLFLCKVNTLLLLVREVAPET